MKRREAIKARSENRKPNKMYDSDFLLGVYDQTRVGVLRFKDDVNGPFLSDDKETAAPPWQLFVLLKKHLGNLKEMIII